jgi:hypothetical protein
MIKFELKLKDLWMRMMDNRRVKALIEEYKAKQDMYKHFNVLKWQVGSVLIGAIAVVTGFAFSSDQASRWFPFLFFSLILMVTWGVYGELCTLWNQQKIRRLHKLEEDLDFYQHRYCDWVRPRWYQVRAYQASHILAVGWILLVLGLAIPAKVILGKKAAGK